MLRATGTHFDQREQRSPLVELSTLPAATLAAVTLAK